MQLEVADGLACPCAGYTSWRSHVWNDVDPDRTGILPFVWDADFGFERYVEYALDVPMYFLYRNGRYEDATQQRCTFREYMDGHLPINPSARLGRAFLRPASQRVSLRNPGPGRGTPAPALPSAVCHALLLDTPGVLAGCLCCHKALGAGRASAEVGGVGLVTLFLFSDPNQTLTQQ